MKKIAPFLILALSILSVAQAQSPDSKPPIFWQNPSFEGEPANATVPIGWIGCEPLTTPDILPGFWGIYQEASEGETYVGLITRANGSWESITQRLERTIEVDDCYVFQLDLARGATYSGYNQPLKLRVWGSTDRCSKDQLLFESERIEHTYWKTYRIEVKSEQPIRYIILEAFHQEGKFRYSGNILIDNLTPLYWCPRV